MSDPIKLHDAANDLLDGLRRGETTVWKRSSRQSTPLVKPAVVLRDIADAAALMERFRPALQILFPSEGWDGRIVSQLWDYPAAPYPLSALMVKADHDLPVTGSIKARGGIYALLCRVERIAFAEGILKPGDNYVRLTEPSAMAALSRHTVAVASTGNLAFSIGLVARAFGLRAQVHMSQDAKLWKKQRLTKLGVEVVEHRCDFSETVLHAEAAAQSAGHEFIDDTTSRELFIGYAIAADELLGQLADRGIVPSEASPLVVYLPCGVGGAPGGVTFGLKERLGKSVFCVFVEPACSACMMVALAKDTGYPISVYDAGLDNRTLADGLAVPIASKLVLDLVGDRIDAVVALPETTMVEWVRRAWKEAGLRLEPSAAAALAAIEPLLEALPHLSSATHIAWTTGGSLMPDSEFLPLIDQSLAG